MANLPEGDSARDSHRWGMFETTKRRGMPGYLKEKVSVCERKRRCLSYLSEVGNNWQSMLFSTASLMTSIDYPKILGAKLF